MNATKILTMTGSAPARVTPGMQNHTSANPVGIWIAPLSAPQNDFQRKAPFNWTCNIAFGCSHACGLLNARSFRTSCNSPVPPKSAASTRPVRSNQQSVIRSIV
jgi:hypothetical protein